MSPLQSFMASSAAITIFAANSVSVRAGDMPDADDPAESKPSPTVTVAISDGESPTVSVDMTNPMVAISGKNKVVPDAVTPPAKADTDVEEFYESGQAFAEELSSWLSSQFSRKSDTKAVTLHKQIVQLQNLLEAVAKEVEENEQTQAVMEAAVHTLSSIVPIPLNLPVLAVSSPPSTEKSVPDVRNPQAESKANPE